MFDQVAKLRRDEWLSRIGQHEEGAVADFDEAESQRRQALAVGAMAAAAAKEYGPGVVANEQVLLGEIDGRSRRRGLDEAGAHQARVQALVAARAQVVEQLADVDPGKAQAWLDAHRADIGDPATLERLDRMLHPFVEEQQADRIAGEIRAGTSGLDAQIAGVDGRELSPDLAAAVKETLQRRARADDAATAAAQKQAADKAWSIALDPAATSLRTIPPMLYATLAPGEQDGILQAISANARMEDPAPDPALYLALSDKAVRGVLTIDDVRHAWGKLPRDEWSMIAGWQHDHALEDTISDSGALLGRVRAVSERVLRKDKEVRSPILIASDGNKRDPSRLMPGGETVPAIIEDITHNVAGSPSPRGAPPAATIPAGTPAAVFPGLGLTVNQLSQHDPAELVQLLKNQAILNGQPTTYTTTDGVSHDIYVLTPYKTPEDYVFDHFQTPSVPDDVNIQVRSTMNMKDTSSGMMGGSINIMQSIQARNLDLPSYIKRVLAVAGIRTVVSGDQVGEYEIYKDYQNALASGGVALDAQGHVTASGTPNGDTVLNLPGIYFPTGGDIILSTSGPFYKSGSPREGSVNMNDHEALHGLDHALGYLSSTSNFLSAWINDNSNFSSGLKQKYYSISTGGQSSLPAALSETFAESGAMFYTDGARLQKIAPNLYAYWKNLDNQLRIGSLPNSSLNLKGGPR